jgi:N-methylhydantoinase B
MVVATPAFHRGEIVAFGVSVAHKADVGGLVPGSSGAASREIFHDGLLLPPVRYWTAGGVNPEVEAIVKNNSRAPEVVAGDLRGQVGATKLGARRFDALCAEYGADVVLAAMASLIERTTARVRAEIARWPDGSFEAEGFMDHDGADKSRPARIHVRATKAGDRLTLDFSGTDPQTKGPINTPQATAQAVSTQAVLAASDPTIPMNAGTFAAIEFAVPPGRIVSPQYPATVNHYFPTSHLVYNCVLAACGQFNPKRAVAPSGMGTGAIAIGYPTGRLGRPTVQYEIMNSSLGGTAEHDGAAMVLPMNHFAPGTPVEIVETEYPVAVSRFDILPDSAQPLRHPARFGRRRAPAGRHRLRPRVCLQDRLHLDRPHLQPPPRRLGGVRGQEPETGRDPHPPPRRHGRRDGHPRDPPGRQGLGIRPQPERRRRLRRPAGARAGAGAARRRERLCHPAGGRGGIRRGADGGQRRGR